MPGVYVREGADARQLDEGQIADENQAGGVKSTDLLSKDEATEMAQHEADRKLADKELTDTDKAIFGGLSGLTAGFGTAGLVKGMELMGDKDAPLARHLISGSQNDGAYQAAQLGGFVGGSVITGGVLDELGLTAKLGALLPEAQGIMGSAIRAGSVAGARGALEGSVIGLGNAAEEAALTNKRMSAEAVLARMGEGALVGGGLGTVFGGAAGALRGAANRGKGAIEAALGRAGRVAEDAVEGKAPKLGKGLMREVGTMEGGMPGFLDRAEKGLEIEGLKLTSDPGEVVKAADKLQGEANKLKISVARAFDDKASGAAPSWSNFTNRVRDEVVGDALMSPAGEAQAKKIQAWLDKVAPVNMDIPSKFEGGSGFEGWVKNADVFDKYAKGMDPDVVQKVKAIYRDELNQAMEHAEFKAPELKGQAANYKAMELQAQTMRILKDANEGKLASFEPGVNLKELAKTHGPGVSEMMWRMSNATKLVSATKAIKVEIASALGEFLSARNRAVTGMATNMRSRTGAVDHPDFSRANFDAELQNAQKLVSASREERERYYLRHTGSMALAGAMADVSDKAAAYIAPLMPASQKVRQATKLRPMVESQTLRPEEHRFLKRWGIIKSPLSALQDLKSGRLSKDSVDVLKNVWPETYQAIVETAQEKIVEMKAKGESLPIDSLTQLSILLDTPLDSTLSKSFIDPVQAAMNESPAPAPKQPPPVTPDNSSKSYETPVEDIVGG